MADSFDKSLDDIIQAKKSARGRGGRGRGRGRGGRGAGGGRGRGGGSTATRRARGQRGTPYSRPNRQIPDKWEHDMYQAGGAFSSPRGKQGGGSKLMISNLDYGVSDADLRELFSEFGRLVKAEVHYDKSGRSLGTGTIIYGRNIDAQRAVTQYNGVPLDGRPMSIQVLGSGAASTQNSVGGGRQQQPQRGRQQLTGYGRGGRGGRGRGGRGRGGRGRGRGKGPVPTAEELDAELDAYNKQNEPMET